MATDLHPLLDQADPRAKAAEESERRLFEHYGVPYRTTNVDLVEPRIRIRVLEAGTGTPVLIVPGGPGDAWVYAPLMAQLADFRMIAINRPGGGLSEGVDHRALDDRRLAVDTLSAVLDHFGLERAPVIGNSMGGLWSFYLALDRPKRVSAVVQLGTPALILDTNAPLPMRLMSIPGLNRLLVKKMVPKTYAAARGEAAFLGHPKEVGAGWPEEMAACNYHFRRLPNFQVSWLSLMEKKLTMRRARPGAEFDEDKLRRINQPVLLLWGSNDPFGSLETARRAEAVLPHAELVETGVGHIPWWDEADRCAGLIRGFLARKGLLHEHVPEESK
jgi:pimeloyl-ACP methyl ester carboxylesterase